MKQTSQAVASLLMLGTTSAFLAGNISPIQNVMADWQAEQTFTWVPNNPAGNTPPALDSAGPNFTFTSATPTEYDNVSTDGAVASMSLISATNDHTLWNPTCTACIMLNGVWCSQAWTFETAVKPEFPSGGGSLSANNDKGQCCFGTDGDQTMMQVADAGLTGVVMSVTYNKNTCPAIFPDVAWAASGTDIVVADIAQKFWCSNGWFLNLSAVVGDQLAAFKNYAFSGSSDVRQNLKDWYLVSCRQRSDMCGGAGLIDVSSTTIMRAIGYAETGTTIDPLANGEKCSFAVRTVEGAPVFSMAVPSDEQGDSAAAGTITDNTVAGTDLAPTWMISYIEFPEQAMTDSLTAADSPTTESSAGFPMVFTDSAEAGCWINMGSACTDVDVANDNVKQSLYFYSGDEEYLNLQEHPGAMRQVSRNVADDGWVSRYFDNHGANLAIDSYSARTEAFDGLAVTYATDAGTYNEQLELKELADAIDAFTAFFTPPEEVVVPVRPNKPTTPAAYDQYVLSSYWAYNGVDEADFNPANADANYILGENTWMPYLGLGGWGQITRGGLSASALHGKSYGTFGSDSLATNWAIGGGSNMYTSGSFSAYYVANMDTTDCVASASNTKSTQTCLTTGAPAASGSYLVVTLFPTSFNSPDFAAGTGNLEFSFSQGAWVGMGAMRAPTTPTAAAPDLETPAGATGLAVSATVALALAALY